ncbi:hypothetical protein HID58_062258 [Brassica napus]|uniref:Leucine-rich repeat-containing N-terminal plant-type domain-containing protein n=1 Tax=Brassica napus TaxID=3708 RepID=A0ABQ8A1G4_BRANA|nr:hypothetical protein HID58_062258 [Brassica napus]
MVIIQGQRYSLCGAITIYFFCFLHPLSNSFASPTRSMCRPDQRDILLEFKSEFPKEEFSEFPKFSASLWDENGDCCSWDGVTCDGTFGKVISLQLMSYSGNNSLKFNSALFKLQNLRQLRLSNCYLYGEISSSFGNLSRLTYLDLSQNQLVGEFPISIGNLNQLTYLSLSENNLHGNIPISLANLTKLSQLDLSENQFTGGISHLKLSNLTSLILLNLFSNNFQSTLPRDLSRLCYLEYISNYFTGTLPPSYFSNWRDMSTSSIEDDTLYVHMDEYMADDEYWPSYGEKYHNSMEMVNKGVEMEFGRIRKDYKAIDFSGNRLYGSIPESIGLLKGLRLLNLSGNAFTSNIPQSLANLTVLETLDVSRNKLSGHIPLELGNISSLSNMNFSHNFLEGSVPRGTQFQSQKCSSFMDNPKLDGLQEICGETHSPNPTTPQDSEDLTEQEEPVFNWIAAAIAYGPGIFCGLVIGHIWFMEKVRQNKPRVLTINTR